jgi:hypothetical protein
MGQLEFHWRSFGAAQEFMNIGKVSVVCIKETA